jgi:flagellar assembly factor FliW
MKNDFYFDYPIQEELMEENTLKINTIHFGELEIQANHIYHFAEGLLGFEDLTKFVLISEEETDPFKWLISIDNPDIGFPLISPFFVDLEYKPGRDINLDLEVPICVVTLGDLENNMTVNLKAPIIFNVKELTGKQIIVLSDKYSTNHVLGKRK